MIPRFIDQSHESSAIAKSFNFSGAYVLLSIGPSWCQDIHQRPFQTWYALSCSHLLMTLNFLSFLGASNHLHFYLFAIMNFVILIVNDLNCSAA